MSEIVGKDITSYYGDAKSDNGLAAEKSPNEANSAPSPGPWIHAGQCCVCEDRDGKPGRLLFVLRHPHGTSDLIPIQELWADTRMCAAAPDLLAAALDNFAILRSAIAKATGQPDHTKGEG